MVRIRNSPIGYAIAATVLVLSLHYTSVRDVDVERETGQFDSNSQSTSRPYVGPESDIEIKLDSNSFSGHH